MHQSAHRRWFRSMLAMASVLALAVACQAAVPASPTPAAGEGKLAVFGAFATQIEEPWDGVIHRALEAEQSAGRITYAYSDDLGYSGDMERELMSVAQGANPPDIIFGDALPPRCRTRHRR